MKKLFLALGLMLGVLLCPFFAAEGVLAAEEKTVTISVEKFTLGQGYYMEPVTVPFTDGETAADVTLRVLGTENCRYDAGSFYLRHIYDPDAGTPNFPKYIRNAVMLAMDETDISAADAILARGRNEADWLGEFDYFTNSGWMITVNNVFIPTSAGVHYLKDGDVVRWQYTIVGLGADLGDDDWSNSYVDAADKDALTEKMAEILKDKDAYINGDATKQRYFDNAMFILTTMTATQEQVDMVLANLNGTSTEEPSMPDPDYVKPLESDSLPVKSVSLHRTEQEMEVGETFQLLAFIAPLDAANQNVSWKSSAPAIASVDENGVVTALKPGKAEITVTTEDGGKTASCMITVNDNIPVVVPFTDLTADWYKEAVTYVYAHGLMNGTGNATFAPDTNLTRAMMATILYRIEGSPKVTTANPFTDVQGGWYYDAVIWAAENKIVEGMGNGTFAPDANITREQMALMMYRYAKFKNADVSAADNLAGFTDAGDVSNWAKDAMKWAVAEELINGMTTTTLVPQGTANRSQAAMVLMRFNENIL